MRVLGYGLNNVPLDPLSLSRLVYWVNKNTNRKYEYPGYIDTGDDDGSKEIDEESMRYLTLEISQDEELSTQTGLHFQLYKTEDGVDNDYPLLMVYFSFNWFFNADGLVEPSFLNTQIPPNVHHYIEDLATTFVLPKGYFIAQLTASPK